MRSVSNDRGGAVPASRDVVGRAHEIATIASRLADGERALTLVGPGGVGKTVVAQAVAEVIAASADFGWTAFVPCDEVGSEAALADAIAGLLGLSGERAATGVGDGRDARDVGGVGRALASRGPGVLILDGLDGFGAERVFALTLERWLAIAPELSLLVTARAPLGHAGERLDEIGPLALPAALEDPLSAPAIRCFVLAAGRARPGYAPAPSELPFLIEIVHLLDGHPLALGLAAARLAVMGERALLHRLRQSLAVLGTSGTSGTSGTRTAGKSGVRSVATAMAGSWAASTPRERAVLAACSVFRGGFTLEALEAVAPGDDLLDVVQRLRTQSLVRAQPVAITASAPTPGSSAGGDMRLSLYALVRAFAAERLVELGDSAICEARHAAFYAAGPAGAATPQARHAFALVERENLLAVVERVIALPLVTARAAEPALRALCLLGPLARWGGPTSATLALLAPALRATQGSGADPRLRAEVLALRAEASRRAGQLPSAARDLLEAAAIARAVDDAWLVAEIDNQLAFLGASRGELGLAQEHHERAARAFASLGRRDGEGDALRGLAAVLARKGERRAARACLERALAAHRLAGDEAALAEDELLLGTTLLDEGDPAARAAYQRSARHAEIAGDHALLAWARAGVAHMDHDAGDLDAANDAYVRAALDLDALGQPMASAVFVGLQGIVARAKGRAGEAYAQLSAALDVLGAGGERVFGLLLRAHLAAVEAQAGRTNEARALWATIAAAHEPGTEPTLRAALAVLAAQAEIAGSHALSPREATFHARIALRCSPASSLEPRSATPLPLPPDALLLGPGASFFRAPHGERVSLERRRPMALLLDALVTARLATPGRAVSSDELLAAAWPGEKVIASAGAHRVRVAIASLRKLGLRELLQTIEPGYRLASDVVAIRLG